MNPSVESDAEQWTRARSLRDIGRLTAAWLERSLSESPWYGGPPNPETAEIVPILAALNHIGFVTTASQPGRDPVDGYAQRASVSGYASWALADLLEGATATTELVTVKLPAVDVPSSIPITVSAERASAFNDRSRVSPACTFGGSSASPLAIRQMYSEGPAELGYPALSDEALALLAESARVTVIDPVWGRRELLWSVLEDVVARWR